MTDARRRIDSLFDLAGRVAVITGGGGLLGEQHARAIAGAGGIPVLVDIRGDKAVEKARTIANEFDVPAWGYQLDITSPEQVKTFLSRLIERLQRIDILINNAANNPRMEAAGQVNFSRLEHLPLSQWQEDLAVGLTGAFLCSQIIGSEMAHRKRGVIVNVSSDLALIGPDQRLYWSDNLAEDQQPAKPVTYSVVKSGLLGLTRYLATYWAGKGVRVNAISPGGVYAQQPAEFVSRLTSRIPMGRMATVEEYRGAIVFLVSDASSYMTGANLVVDGGRTCW